MIFLQRALEHGFGCLLAAGSCNLIQPGAGTAVSVTRVLILYLVLYGATVAVMATLNFT